MKKGENIFKRKDGRWEARYIKGYELSGKIKYGFCYGKTYKEAKEKVSDDWGAFKSMGDISTTTISKRGVNAAVAYVTATYENVEIHYTLAFDEDMKLASFGMQ